MIGDLKPYPKTKDSGVRWLGDIPERWDSAVVRRYCRVFAGATPSRSVPNYWTGGTIPWLSSGDVNQRRITQANQFITPAGFAASSTKWISPGSLVLALAGQGRTKGMVATVECDATCNQSLAVLKPSPSKSDYRFLAFYLESRYTELRSLVGDDLRDGLNLEHVRAIPTPLPPLAEQSAIVRFLDHADRRIRRYISAKQRLIKLLEEQKEAIIHRAVTRGIDPIAHLKPSGIEWLGDIPEHWELLTLRRKWRVTDCKHLTVPFVDNGIPLASVREAQSFELNLATSNHTTLDYYESLIEGGRKPEIGDLIYCRNVGVGAAALVTTEERFAMGQDVCLIRSHSENHRWLPYFLRSKAMSDQLALILVGSTFTRINVADIKSLLIALPPTPEQKQIVSFLDSEVGRVDAAISRNRTAQNLASEFRTSLISEVVTGKLDVRGTEEGRSFEGGSDLIEEDDACGDDSLLAGRFRTSTAEECA